MCEQFFLAQHFLQRLQARLTIPNRQKLVSLQQLGYQGLTRKLTNFKAQNICYFSIKPTSLTAKVQVNEGEVIYYNVECQK
jgi:hypothetical protein